VPVVDPGGATKCVVIGALGENIGFESSGRLDVDVVELDAVPVEHRCLDVAGQSTSHHARFVREVELVGLRETAVVVVLPDLAAKVEPLRVRGCLSVAEALNQ
jgi:hypothetical protein